MEIKQLPDGRIQVIGDDGEQLTLPYWDWSHFVHWFGDLPEPEQESNN